MAVSRGDLSVVSGRVEPTVGSLPLGPREVPEVSQPPPPVYRLRGRLVAVVTVADVGTGHRRTGRPCEWVPLHSRDPSYCLWDREPSLAVTRVDTGSGW